MPELTETELELFAAALGIWAGAHANGRTWTRCTGGADDIFSPQWCPADADRFDYPGVQSVSHVR